MWSIRPDRPALVGAFGLLVLLVGTNIVAIRASNRELAPFWNAGLRFSLAAVAFSAIAIARGASRPSATAVRDGVLYGFLAFAAFFGFLYLGLVRATAGLGQVILALGPLATYAMARGYVDFWLCWIAVDLVGVPELLHFHFYPSAVLYGIYGAFVIWGFFAWLRVARTEGPARGAAAPRPDEVRA